MTRNGKSTSIYLDEESVEMATDLAEEDLRTLSGLMRWLVHEEYRRRFGLDKPRAIDLFKDAGER